MKIRFEGGLFWGARQQPFTRSMTRHVDRHNEAESTPGPGITGRMTGSAGHGTIANRRLLCRPFDQRITGWETAASSGVPISEKPKPEKLAMNSAHSHHGVNGAGRQFRLDRLSRAVAQSDLLPAGTPKRDLTSPRDQEPTLEHASAED